MNNNFTYSNDNKRYHTLNYFYQQKFNSKVFKVSLNANFSCPHKINGKGCIFCSKSGSGDFAGNINEDLKTQFENVKDVISKKWPNSKYIAYFQANTNTYAPLHVLKEKYEEVLKYDNVVGLSIATRSDSITDEVLDYLTELNKKTFLTIELGLQSAKEETLKYINRGHDLKSFEDMVKKLKMRNINTVVHIINGLPNETKEDMLNTITYLDKLKIDGLKIHMLYISKDTELENIYNKEKFHLLTKKEYVDIVCDQLELLSPDIVINRITGDPVAEDLIEPNWLLKKFTVLNEIDKELVRRDTHQGFKKSILNYVRKEIDNHVKKTDYVVDATFGNGNDTLYLCERAKYVFGFDIQNDAFQNAKKLLKDKYDNHVLMLLSHSEMYEKLKDYRNKISLVLFNLGYLPKGNKNITTNSDTTIKAIDDSLKMLNNNGKIILTIYPGHESGLKESIAILNYLKDNKIKYTEFHNTDNIEAPYLITIKKVDN